MGTPVVCFLEDISRIIKSQIAAASEFKLEADNRQQTPAQLHVGPDLDGVPVMGEGIPPVEDVPDAEIGDQVGGPEIEPLVEPEVEGMIGGEPFAMDPGLIDYLGGKSLMSQSHGQSLMAFFTSRFKIKGIYFLDEPETALSPKSQLELLNLLKEMARLNHAQFIIASHSPILLACPGAAILSFDENPVKQIDYEATDHYRIYKKFMADPKKFLQ